MEVVQDNSLLATYLEGQGEGLSDPVEEENPHEDALQSVSNFAPRGPPRSLRDRLQRVLPPRLELELKQKYASWHDIQHACRRVVLSGFSKGEDDRFLEHFRYLIIASQLLVEGSRPASHYAHPLAADTTQKIEGKNSTPGTRFSLLGAFTAATSSFIVALSFHLVRTRYTQSAAAVGIWLGLLSSIIVISTLSIYVYIRRKSSERIRRNATTALSILLDEVHELDRVTGVSLRLCQEVEIVARGYEISQPLPPISRIEDQSTERRCGKLRAKLAESLSSSITGFAYAHDSLRDVIGTRDLLQYYEIYDIVVHDYSETVATVDGSTPSLLRSLHDLRWLFRVLILARRVLLCDLLALPPPGRERVPRQWVTVCRIITNLVEHLSCATKELAKTLTDEEQREWGHGAPSAERADGPEQHLSRTPQTPGSAHAQAQMRRLDAISNGIRALNAKMHVLRHEIDTNTDAHNDGASMTSLLVKQYENIGLDLRGLLQEWEKGRSTMFLVVDRSDRFSRSSSSLRSPMSPSPSLGGLTAVDEGPAEALRVLNGEDIGRNLSDLGVSDEEVFEAVSMPKKRMEMTREEKMAKMQEDRRKRATMQERVDSSTNMLRELETVIKHRPRGRTTSRMTPI